MFSRLHETSFTRKTLELLQREFTQAGQTDGGYVALKRAAEDREGWRHRERMSKTRCTAEDCWWRWLDGHPHWQTPSAIILALTTNRTAVKSLHYLSASIFAMIQFRETTEDASQARLPTTIDSVRAVNGVTVKHSWYYSLQDESHSLLAILALKRQRTGQHLKLTTTSVTSLQANITHVLDVFQADHCILHN